MIEELFLQYGALGGCMIIFISFFYKYYTDSKAYQDKLTVVVDNNTVALTKVYEVMSHCSNSKNIYRKI